MSLILLVSILIRLLAMCWTIVLWRRHRRWQMAFPTVMLLLMAARQSATLLAAAMRSGQWSLQLTGHLTELPGLLVSLMALLVVFFLAGLLERTYAVSSAQRHSEDRYRDLYNNTPVMMHSIDSTGKIVEVNDHWLATLSYRREEVLGRRSFEFLTEESRKYAREVGIPQFLASGQAENVPYQMVTRDGRALDVLLSSTAERDEKGRLVRSRARIVDVSALKRVEAEREAVIRQLEQKNAELERFTYTVSHDLKSPLVTIRNYLGFVQRDMERGKLERLRGDVDRVLAATDQMTELLDDLLELSRIGRLMNTPQEVDLSEIAHQAVKLLAGHLSERGVVVEIAPDLPRVWGDRLRLLEVLQNLIENAFKFSRHEAEPRIEIGCRQQDGERVSFVRDNGVGIDPRYREKIFGLFEQLEPDSEGTGVGLALVQRIVEVHGGRIWVESPGPGHGATFCFTLPAPPFPDDSGAFTATTDP